jgi:hypothetical protein
MEIEVRLRVVLAAPPPGVVFGLQHGKGGSYQTIQKQTSKGDDLGFDSVATPVGSNVSFDLSSGQLVTGGVTLTFTNVTGAGAAARSASRRSRRSWRRRGTST